MDSRIYDRKMRRGQIRKGGDLVASACTQRRAAPEKERDVGAETRGKGLELFRVEFNTPKPRKAEQGRGCVAAPSAQPCPGGDPLAQCDMSARARINELGEPVGGFPDEIGFHGNAGQIRALEFKPGGVPDLDPVVKVNALKNRPDFVEAVRPFSKHSQRQIDLRE